MACVIIVAFACVCFVDLVWFVCVIFFSFGGGRDGVVFVVVEFFVCCAG